MDNISLLKIDYKKNDAIQVEEMDGPVGREVKELRNKINTALLDIQRQIWHQIKNTEQQIAANYSITAEFIKEFQDIGPEIKTLVAETKSRNNIKEGARKSFVNGVFGAAGASLVGGFMTIAIFIVSQYLNGAHG